VKASKQGKRVICQLVVQKTKPKGKVWIMAKIFQASHLDEKEMQ